MIYARCYKDLLHMGFFPSGVKHKLYRDSVVVLIVIGLGTGFFSGSNQGVTSRGIRILDIVQEVFSNDEQKRDSSVHSSTGPSRVEPISGTALSRIVLTVRAAQRLDITTAPVEDRLVHGRGRLLTVPYAAVLYDTSGNTWVYTNPESLVYVRQEVVVDNIIGATAVLSSGPPIGTTVVTVGVAELFGIEFGVGK